MFNLSSFCSLLSTVVSSLQQVIDTVWAPYASLLGTFGATKPSLSSLLSPIYSLLGCTS